jgi:hypothetical protein
MKSFSVYKKGKAREVENKKRLPGKCVPFSLRLALKQTAKKNCSRGENGFFGCNGSLVIRPLKVLHAHLNGQTFT